MMTKTDPTPSGTMAAVPAVLVERITVQYRAGWYRFDRSWATRLTKKPDIRISELWA